MVYSFFLMRTYVSFRHDVSNGGFPTSSVYLRPTQRAQSHTIMLTCQRDGRERRSYVQNAAQGPDVHLEAVALLAQHLGGDVVRRPAQRLLPLAVELDLGGQAEVTWEDGDDRIKGPVTVAARGPNREEVTSRAASPILTSMSSLRNRFPSFRSRWMTRLLWR